MALVDAPEVEDEEADGVVLPCGNVKQAPDFVLNGAEGAEEEEALELHHLRLAADVLDEGTLGGRPPDSRLGGGPIELWTGSKVLKVS